MSDDDKLKAILNRAQNDKAKRDADDKAKEEQHVSDMRAAGKELRERVLPRLEAARDTWAPSNVKLTITDRTEGDFSDRYNTNRRVPEIDVSLSSVGYSFRSHAKGYAYIRHASGRNRGNNAYRFKVERIEDLTDELIDQVLESLVRRSNGLEPDE